MRPDMPAIAIENASLPNEHIVYGTISSLPRSVHDRAGNGPTLILVGEALENKMTLAAKLGMATAE
jgi:uroporphyrin-III C-methyltransferase/precorrin-2 dehydrogenase/sirohydrochlorin ferrochelatase/uroporphyrin-III C-methyltransferase